MCMKEAIAILAIVVFLIGMVVWSLMAGEKKSQEYYEKNIKPDIDACRALGKYPVTSKWDGELKECKEF